MAVVRGIFIHSGNDPGINVATVVGKCSSWGITDVFVEGAGCNYARYADPGGGAFPSYNDWGFCPSSSRNAMLLE